MNAVLLLAGLPAAISGQAAPQQGAAGEPVPGDENRPNIIYIMTDQQWAGAMSCAGNTDLHTPAMDALAEGSAFHECLLLIPVERTLPCGYVHRTDAFRERSGGK